MRPGVDFVATGDRETDYAKLRKDLQQVVGRLCPTWLSSQRDDLVQAALMRVMQIVDAEVSGRDQVRSLAPSYLYKVAHSALVDEIRRVRRRQESSLDDHENVMAVMAASVDPERIAASHQVGRGIQECLSLMSRERRLAVTMYLQGHTVPEAARILDWSAKRTENLVYRGLVDLRTCLMKKGIWP